jgi:type IV pilus assembly protein PilB
MTDVELDDRLGELLVAQDVLPTRALARAQEFQRTRNGTLAGALVQLRLVGDDRLRLGLEELTGVRAIDPSLLSVYADFVERVGQLIPADVTRRLLVFPVQMELNTIHVCMLNPTDRRLTSSLEALSGCRVQPCVSHETALIAALNEHLRAPDGSAIAYTNADPVAVAGEAWQRLVAQPLETFADNAIGLINRNRDAIRRDPAALDAIVRDPIVIRFVQQILCRAIEAGASDIHVEPGTTSLRVRLRVDGAMQLMCTLPSTVSPAVLARLKAMAELPLQPAAAPLDSRIGYDLALGRSIDLRFSLVPSITGETIVLRVLERGAARRTLEQLGVGEQARQSIEDAIDLPNGLVLVTGPTGSGKSSTLYALLDRLNGQEASIVTAEDPVESRVDGVTQVQCQQEGLTFATALRSFLRQDPDVLMVGEIRDMETADIALKASLTGHLVLSSLHTNDAAGAVLRLINMELEPFVIASALRLVIAQRLIRRLCAVCRRPSQSATDRLIGMAAQTELALPASVQAFERVGCAECANSGYRGRTGIFEVLRVTERIEELVLARASAIDLRTAARADGMRSLRDAALLRAATGETSLEEVLQHTIAAGSGPAERQMRSPIHA